MIYKPPVQNLQQDKTVCFICNQACFKVLFSRYILPSQNSGQSFVLILKDKVLKLKIKAVIEVLLAAGPAEAIWLTPVSSWHAGHWWEHRLDWGSEPCPIVAKGDGASSHLCCCHYSPGQMLPELWQHGWVQSSFHSPPLQERALDPSSTVGRRLTFLHATTEDLGS